MLNSLFHVCGYLTLRCMVSLVKLLVKAKTNY